MTKTKKETLWNVQFVEDYAITTATVEAKDEDEAVERAVKEMLDYYGRDFSMCSVEVEPWEYKM